MTKEDEKATIAALLEERRGYVNRGEDDRVAEVDKALKHLGYKAAPAVRHAHKRPAAEKGSSTR